MTKRLKVIPVAVLLLAGCATYQDGPESARSDAGLAGSSWSLVSFQSMDDTQGTTSPDVSKTYTLDFGTDGRLAMQLDCNRGNAIYSQGQISEGGGSLTIGPIAATKALCPPPDIGEMLATQLPHVVSYTIRDGHMFLALKMDGGIFEFSPR